MTIKFGTDGWRAVISENFTFENVYKVAQAFADVTNEQFQQEYCNAPNLQPALVVGFDTRFLSDRYAVAVAEVLAGNNIRVWLSNADVPTPMVSYAIVDKQAHGGVMITASHNPPRYNGMKLKASYGGSATTATCKAVEQRIHLQDELGQPPQRVPYTQALKTGLIERFNPLPAYRKQMQRLVDFEAIQKAGLSVAVDAMYGAGRIYLRQLLETADCYVTELRSEMNPGFNGIHPEPVLQHLQPLVAEMKTGKYQLGLATDGDADRIGAIDPDGRFINPHQIMALLVDYLIQERNLRGSIVKTVSTTQMLNQLADHYGLQVHETPVGFNYISDLMLQEPVLLGGEESGGISIFGHIPEGDGLLMGLLLTELVAKRGKPLGALVNELMERPYIGHFSYGRDDRAVQPFKKTELIQGLMANQPYTLAGSPVAQVNNQDGVKFILKNKSWLLIRPSGTEPVLRIYVEAHSDEAVATLLKEGAELAQRMLTTVACKQ